MEVRIKIEEGAAMKVLTLDEIVQSIKCHTFQKIVNWHVRCNGLDYLLTVPGIQDIANEHFKDIAINGIKTTTIITQT